MSQQPPLPHQRFHYWFSRQTRTRKLLLGGVVLFAVLLLCVCSTVASTNRTTNQSTNQSIATATAASQANQSQSTDQTATVISATVQVQPVLPTSISTAVPTAIPTKTVITTPRLGGRIADFIATYGQPNNHSDANSFHWFRDSSSAVDGLIVWSLTHPHQADSITVAPVNGAIWTATTAQTACTTYNPPDTHQVKRVSLVDSSGKIAGFDVIYASNTLAHEFTASDFTDSNGNVVQRGSFDIQYLYTLDGSQHIDSCNSDIGEQQTTV